MADSLGAILLRNLFLGGSHPVETAVPFADLLRKIYGGVSRATATPGPPAGQHWDPVRAAYTMNNVPLAPRPLTSGDINLPSGKPPIPAQSGNPPAPTYFSGQNMAPTHVLGPQGGGQVVSSAPTPKPAMPPTSPMAPRVIPTAPSPWAPEDTMGGAPMQVGPGMMSTPQTPDIPNLYSTPIGNGSIPSPSVAPQATIPQPASSPDVVGLLKRLFHG